MEKRKIPPDLSSEQGQMRQRALLREVRVEIPVKNGVV